MQAVSDIISDLLHEIKIARINGKIQNKFGKHAQIAMAVAKAESGLNPEAKGWNCRYGSTSKACAKEDRDKAWSVDCGIFQINFKGQECPPESLNEDWNIDKAYEWKFSRSGWHPWSVCKNGTVACGI